MSHQVGRKTVGTQARDTKARKGVKAQEVNLEKLSLEAKHKQALEESSAPAQSPSPVTLAEKSSSAIYIPINDAQQSEEVIWQHVMKTFDSMAQHDFVQNDENFNAHSMKYLMNTYMLARTRLCRIRDVEDEESTGQLFLELRKLEGDGFCFNDEFRKEMEVCLSQVNSSDEENEEKSKETKSSEPELDLFNFLDLSENGKELVENWLQDLKPQVDLVFDRQKVYGALSSLGWNSKNSQNKEFLMQYSKQIVDSCVDVLRHIDFLPVNYFAGVCMYEFSDENFSGRSWEEIAVICEVIRKWTMSVSEVEQEAVRNHEASITVREISRSREVCRLLLQTLLKLEGGKIEGSKDRSTKRKISNLFKRDLSFAVDAEVVGQLKKVLEVK